MLTEGNMSVSTTATSPVIGVLALQGAFEEHQSILESLGCKTVQIRTPSELSNIDGLVLPGGESTAMGLIGNGILWNELKSFISSGKPTWGTCAGMVLLAERCVGTSAVIENGQSLIGGLEVVACRNYFGSQISSFEMCIDAPPGFGGCGNKKDYPGIFIRAPAILDVYGDDVKVLTKVVATPCKKASKVLEELDRKIQSGDDVLMSTLKKKNGNMKNSDELVLNGQEEKKDLTLEEVKITLPGAAVDTNAREVICAVRKGNLLCTAFHPELTSDPRWHQYFLDIVEKYNK